MGDLVTAFGLVLVIEGVLWAAAPSLAKMMARQAAEMPDAQLRMGGIIAAISGVFIVWLVRG